MRMRDGLYRVMTPALNAGFRVSTGEVVSCSPVLHSRFAYWAKFAREVKLRVKHAAVTPSTKRGRLQ